MNETGQAQSEDTSTRHGTTREFGPTKSEPLTHSQRIARWFEIMTAVMLGVVALSTAWSGYQAARWGTIDATKYAQASALRQESARDSTLAGQYRLYDLDLTNNWINAYISGNMNLANIFEKRFRPEFLPVFKAWLALNPFHNPAAPPGPLFMPQYKVGLETQSNKLDTQASITFNAGQSAAEHSDDYVLNTVFLATVLFLTAVADRFDIHTIRAVILAVALAMLLFGLYHLIVYPVA